ncbi:hypothetical protein FRC19_008357 [Serendipita sp. 401]|nr:hypothetical protein FRC19_008357 [Serendipita sp. 401]
MCGGSILPIILLRRQSLQATPESYQSYADLTRQLSRKSSTYRNLASGAISFGIYALLNAVCAASLGADTWHPFMPTKRHSMNLNEQVMFLVLGNVLAGLVIAGKDLLARRDVVKWPTKISLRPYNLLNQASDFLTIRPSAVLASGTVTVYTILYWLFRKRVYRLLMRLPLLGVFFKPFILQAARPSTSLPIFFYLLPRLLVLSVITVIQYENAQALFDSLASRGMLVARDSPDPDACIRSGLEVADPYYKHFAYLELAHTARKGPATRRIAIYNDSQKWHFISRTCFKVMGEDYGHLRRRGKPAPPPPPPAPPAPVTPGIGSLSMSLHGSTMGMGPPATPRKSNVVNLGSSVYKPLPPPSPGTLLIRSILSASTSSPVSNSSGGSPSTTPTTNGASPGGVSVGGSTDGPKSLSKSGVMPSVFVTLPPAELIVQPAAAAPPAPAGSGGTISVMGMIWNGLSFVIGQLTARMPTSEKSVGSAGGEPFFVLPGFVKSAIKRHEKERVELMMDGVLRNRAMDRLCIQILTGLTVASLTEDAYGTLQQDIPKVLEVLVRTLIALEQYAIELSEAAAATGDEEAEMETYTAITKLIVPFTNDIKSALHEILHTFGDRLNVFRLPHDVAKRLKLFVNA